MKRIFIWTFLLLACTSCSKLIDKNKISDVPTSAAVVTETPLPTPTITPVPTPNPLLSVSNITPQNVAYDLIFKGKIVKEIPLDVSQTFSTEPYSNLEGVFNFRGGSARNQPSFGTISKDPSTLSISWSFQTLSSSWGGGAGWTGQPAIVKWESSVRKAMNIKEEFKQTDHFTEAIYASLDGNIYFFDLESGKPSRDPIHTGNPIKGSVSIDPRGYPLLYVGQGIPENGTIGFKMYSLVDGKELYFINGLESYAGRKWGAFDGSALINKDTDTLYEGGENSVFYAIKLNTVWDGVNISISPVVTRYRAGVEGRNNEGIENSVASYKNILYFANNQGDLQALDSTTLKPIWAVRGKDDTDATLVIDEENDTPFVYTGTEVDKQGSQGFSYLQKRNGVTGALIWEQQYAASSLLGKDPVNGGLLATPVVGKGKIDHLVIFTIARYKTFNGGLMVALNKNTGKEVWRLEMPNYAWSSPVDIYTSQQNGYLLQGDSAGKLHLINGIDGKLLYSLDLKTNIEASPAVFNNQVVLATRGGFMYGISID